MTEKIKPSPSNFTSYLPFPLKLQKQLANVYYYLNNNNQKYFLCELSKKEYNTYVDLTKAKVILKAIYFFQIEDKYYLLFEDINNPSEPKAISKKMINELTEIFKTFQFSITLKKDQLGHLNNLYKLLDSKFSYIEMRVRELELMPRKNDFVWIILSKYYAILDAKVFLYDLQQDLFKAIEKTEVINYGMIFKDISENTYKNGLIMPSLNCYYGPLGMLYVRYYLAFDHLEIENEIKTKINGLDSLNKKYFCFMVLYIYILNINFDIIPNLTNANSYLQMINRIIKFNNTFKDFYK